jgi:hypothetical protein
MGCKPRQSVALAERRAQVGDLYLQNWTQTAIAERLGISESTVGADLKAIQQSWREAAMRDFDQAPVVEVHKLDRIERFLDQIQKCLTHRRALLELDISAQVLPDQPQEYLSLEERRARLLTIIETIRQRQAAAASKSAADSGESRCDCIDCRSTDLESGPVFNPPRLGNS